MIRRLIALCLAIFGLSIAASAFYAWRYTAPELPQTPVAVLVLSAGADENEMDEQTAARTSRGIDVWRTLPEETLLILSGGGDPERGEPIKAPLMADAARAAGVPDSVIRVEDASGSTLQNALFSKDILAERVGEPVVFVTHRFHGLRAWASLRWAGFTDVTFVPAEGDGDAPVLDGIVLEGIKWPFNVLRGGAFWIATRSGADPDALIAYLN